MKKAEEAFAVQNNASQSKLSQQQKELDMFKDLKKQFEKAQVGEQTRFIHKMWLDWAELSILMNCMARMHA